MAKLYNRRRRVRPKRVNRFRRRRYARRYPLSRSLNPMIHNFTRIVNWTEEVAGGGLVIANGSGGTLSTLSGITRFEMSNVSPTPSYASVGYTFQLANMPGVAEFANLFDQYRITKVVTKIIPYSNSSGTTISGAPNSNADASAMIHYAYDLDDTTIAATEAGIKTLQERRGYRTKRLIGRPITFTIRPRFLVPAAAAGAINMLGPTKAWLDLSNLDVPHYGMKMIFEGLNPNASNSILTFRCETKYYVTFRNPR